MKRRMVLLLAMGLTWSTLSAPRPNILFIAIDDMRPEMACYGARRAITPNIDRLAAQGTRFDRAYVCYALCNPSRTALISGQRVAPFCLPPKAGKDYANVLKLTDPLPKTLRNGGYFTAVYGKFYHGRAGLYDTSHWDVPGPMRVNGVKEWSPTIAKAIVVYGGRADHLMMYLNEKGKEAGGALIWAELDGPDTMLSDGLTAEKTIEVIRKRPKDKPFFIAAGFIRPHLPWIAPKKYFDMYPEGVGELAVTPPGRRTLQTGDSKRGGPTGRYRFMMSKHTGHAELYDLEKDPGEWNNLADDPDQQERIAAFRKKVLEGWRWNEALFERWH